MARYITRPIVILSLVSLFIDISSEMLYTFMPLYLKKIWFSMLLVDFRRISQSHCGPE
jgi:hypothetical protein